VKVVKTILILALVIASVLFAAQNTETVTVTFISWSISGSLSLILVIALILGFIVGTLLMAPSVMRKKFQSFGLRRKVSKLEREKDKLGRKIEKAESAASTSNSAPTPTAVQESQPPADNPAADKEIVAEPDFTPPATCRPRWFRDPDSPFKRK